MLQVFTAIQTKFAGHTDLNNSVTELSFYRASDKPVYPYMVYFPVSGNPHFALGVDDMEKMTLQFSIFSLVANTTGVFEVMHIYDLLTSVFDNCELPMDNWNCIYMRRVNNFLVQSNDGKTDVWHYVVDYELDIDAHPYLTTTVAP